MSDTLLNCKSRYVRSLWSSQSVQTQICCFVLCFFSGLHFTPDHQRAKKWVNEWMNGESNEKFEAHGRRAQDMTRLVIGWMLVHSNLSNKSEKADGNFGGGPKKCGGQNHQFLKVRGTPPSCYAPDSNSHTCIRSYTSLYACLAFSIAVPEGCVRYANIQKAGPALKLQH